jgi:hypothetical protein
MIGPVSGTGRTMMASLQQAIQKGMPPDQAIQYVKSMATQGVAPLTDLYAMMNQFQRMKQQPVQAPQTPPTIRDQLNMAEQQQMAMQQGLGGLPAPAMEQAQFAGGGIVAFAEGGLTAQEEAELDALKQLREDIRTGEKITGGRFAGLSGITPASPEKAGLYELQRARLIELERKAAKAEEASGLAARNAGIAAEAKRRGISLPKPVVAQTAVPPVAPKPDAAPRTDTTSRGGIGSRVPAAPRVAVEAPVEKKMTLEDFQAPLREAGRPLREATDAYRQFLDKDEASAKEQSSRDRMLALAQAGFGMAEAASKPGATFLGSAAAAGGGYAKNMMQLNREVDAAKRGIVKERLALAQAEAAGNKADYVAAYQNLNEYEKRLTQTDQFKQEIDLKRAGLALERSLGFARVNAELMNSAMMAGLRKDEAAARAQNELRDLQAKIVTLADSRIGRLMMDETYRKATAEERAAMEQTEYETAAKLLGGNLLSGGASGSAGQWGPVTVKP